jgi:hypothetical protein
MNDQLKKECENNFFPKNHKGQITIFIMLAIVIVVLGILIYMFYPQIKTTLGFGSKNPSEYIQTCIEEDIENTVKELSLKGGSLAPEHYIMYDDETIEYLCYTGEYYKTCVMQQPMLKQHIESEIEDEIKDKVKTCFNSMKESYEKQAYTVNLKRGETIIELLPKKIVATFNYSLTLTKGDSKKYESFKVVLNNNLYELISIANSILNWEARYGDSETTSYMNYYHDLKVEKKKQSDGTTIYILTDRNNGNKFQFASRSVAWPPGY